MIKCAHLYLEFKEDQKIESTCPKGQEPVRHLLFRFGMSGSFKFHKADEEEIPKHAHLRFTTKDQKYMLSFVDYRRLDAGTSMRIGARTGDPTSSTNTMNTGLMSLTISTRLISTRYLYAISIKTKW